MFFAGQAKNTKYLHDGDVVEAGVGTDDGKIDLGTQRNVVRYSMTGVPDYRSGRDRRRRTDRHHRGHEARAVRRRLPGAGPLGGRLPAAAGRASRRRDLPPDRRTRLCATSSPRSPARRAGCSCGTGTCACSPSSTASAPKASTAIPQANMFDQPELESLLRTNLKHSSARRRARKRRGDRGRADRAGQGRGHVHRSGQRRGAPGGVRVPARLRRRQQPGAHGDRRPAWRT